VQGGGGWNKHTQNKGRVRSQNLCFLFMQRGREEETDQPKHRRDAPEEDRTDPSISRRREIERRDNGQTPRSWLEERLTGSKE